MENERIQNTVNFLNAARVEWKRRGTIKGGNLQQLFEIFHVGRTKADIVERFVAEPITEETAQGFIEAVREYRRQSDARQKQDVQPAIDFDGVERCDMTDKEFKASLVDSLQRIAEALEDYILNH